jgi:hypothetical protein
MSKPRKQHNQSQHKGHDQHDQRVRPWEADTTAGMVVELTSHGLWIEVHDAGGDRDVYLSARQVRALAGVEISARMRALTGLVIAHEEAQEAAEQAEASAGEPVSRQDGRPESGG